MQRSTSPMVTTRNALLAHGDMPVWLNSGLAESWKRCANFGLDPNLPAPFEISSTEAIETAQFKNQNLIEAANSSMDEVAYTLNGLDFGIMLTDNLGLVLNSRIHRSPHLKKVMRPGMDLSEQLVGTSAMSVAISTQRGAEVLGDAHYFGSLSHLKCIASPVFDTDGTLGGILNLTAVSHVPHEIVKQILGQTARKIETKMVRSLSDNIVRFGYGPHISSTDGMLAFGNDGEILGANSCALNMLGLTTISPRSNQFSDFFRAEFGDLISGKHLGRKLTLLKSDTRQNVTVREVSRPHNQKIYGHYSTHPIPITFGDPILEKALTKGVDSLNMRLPVLLCGLSGTGKSLAAQWLHTQSGGSHLESVEVNCGAILPDSLHETLDLLSTGASVGCFYFRDLDLLNPRDQSRLARFIETKPNVALICSTRLPVYQGPQTELREDLYYLLRSGLIHLPTLHSRAQASLLIKKLVKRNLLDRQISSNALNALYSHQWPGNLRELITCIDRIAARCAVGKTVTLKHVLPFINETTTPLPVQTHTRLDTLQMSAINQALAFCNGNRSAAAKRLGISRATLHRKLKARMN